MQTLVLSSVLYLGGLVVGLAMVMTLPRLVALGLRPDRLYPLYGLRYWQQRTVAALSNVKAFVELFGDSSAIPYYLTAIGYRLRPWTQTGSNFGMTVKHENPFLTAVGRDTVVADGLSVMNAEYSPTSFRVSATTIGARNFLGNNIAYPPQGRTGDDCLLATKVAVPVDGPVRTGVGLLGSPSFEIPRTVARDSALEADDPAVLARAMVHKNRHNTVTVALHLLVRWLFSFFVLVAVAAVASLPVRLGALEVVIAEALIIAITIVWFVAVERVAARLKTLAPDGCSIYDRGFWRHERYWKVPSPSWMRLFDGTPFKSWIWRLLGVRIGKRVFDDGAAIIERGFTTIGDECTLGENSVIQSHSQEDGAFKSDVVMLGARVTLGVNSFVHYGTTVGDAAVLAPDTFLMKGEDVPARRTLGRQPRAFHGVTFMRRPRLESPRRLLGGDKNLTSMDDFRARGGDSASGLGGGRFSGQRHTGTREPAMITTAPARPRTQTSTGAVTDRFPAMRRPGADRLPHGEVHRATSGRHSRRGRHDLGVTCPRCRCGSRCRAARDDRRTHASPRRGRPAHDGRAPRQRTRGGTVRGPGRTLGGDVDRTAPPRAGHRRTPAGAPCGWWCGAWRSGRSDSPSARPRSAAST